MFLMSATISRRNARYTLLTAFFNDLAFILPIWLLFGVNELGYSVTLTTALFMVIWLGSGLLEIPTGALADRLGRKRMFLFGVVMLMLYPVGYILRLPVMALFVINAVSAFGSALQSGALVALTHQSYKQEQRTEAEYHSFLSNTISVAFVARAVSGIGGGMLFAYNPVAPFVAMFIAYICMFISGIFIIDTAVERSTLTNRAHILSTARSILSKDILVVIAVMYISFQLIGEAIWTAYQPFFAQDSLSPVAIGGLFTIIAILSTLGSYAAKYLMRRYTILELQVMNCTAICATATLLFLPSLQLHLLAIVPSAFVFGATFAPIQATVQKHIKTTLHSTALSMVSFMQYVVYGVASMVISQVIDRGGLQLARRALFYGGVLAVMIVVGLFLKFNSRDEIVTQKTV